MKILITQTRRCASNPKLAFFKGKVYPATVAVNQPRAFRIVKDGINISKVFAERPDGQTMLLEKGDFVIKQLMPHERAELVTNYLASKIKGKREKLVVPRNLQLREGFRPITEKEQTTPKTSYCKTNKTNSLGLRSACGELAKFIKEMDVPGKKTKIKIPCCTKCATNKVK